MERKKSKFKKFYSKLLPGNKLLKPINTNLRNSKNNRYHVLYSNHEHLTIKNRNDIESFK